MTPRQSESPGRRRSDEPFDDAEEGLIRELRPRCSEMHGPAMRQWLCVPPVRRSRLYQSRPNGVSGQFGAVPHAKLGEDVGAVPFNCLVADHEGARDLLR
jgi:hypothetical protein